MKVINLQDEHKLFNKNSEVDLKVGYHGCGLAFLKKSLDEPLKYCEDLSQGETIFIPLGVKIDLEELVYDY